MYLSFCFPKYLQFLKLSYIILTLNIHVRLKSSVLSENVFIYFSLIYSYICMLFIVSEMLSQKSSFLSIILCYHPFYHPSVRCNASELTEYVSTSFLNCILIVFVCLSLYPSFFSIYLQFYQLSYVIL